MNTKNLHVLKNEELKYFEEKYDIHMAENYVIVKTRNRDFIVAFDSSEKFTLSANNKKITIQPDTIKYWNELDRKYSLPLVQNTVNDIRIKKQEVSLEKVEMSLEKGEI